MTRRQRARRRAIFVKQAKQAHKASHSREHWKQQYDLVLIQISAGFREHSSGQPPVLDQLNGDKQQQFDEEDVRNLNRAAGINPPPDQLKGEDEEDDSDDGPRDFYMSTSDVWDTQSCPDIIWYSFICLHVFIQ